LFDMAGNVEEWTADWYDPKAYQTTEAENPHGPASGEWRVARGGAFGMQGHYSRTSARISTGPATSNASLGFRCARSPGE